MLCQTKVALLQCVISIILESQIFTDIVGLALQAYEIYPALIIGGAVNFQSANIPGKFIRLYAFANPIKLVEPKGLQTGKLNRRFLNHCASLWTNNHDKN